MYRRAFTQTCNVHGHVCQRLGGAGGGGGVALAATIPLATVITWTAFSVPGDPWLPGGREGTQPKVAIPGWLRLTYEFGVHGLSVWALRDLGWSGGAATIGRRRPCALRHFLPAGGLASRTAPMNRLPILSALLAASTLSVCAVDGVSPPSQILGVRSLQLSSAYGRTFGGLGLALWPQQLDQEAVTPCQNLAPAEIQNP